MANKSRHNGSLQQLGLAQGPIQVRAIPRARYVLHRCVERAIVPVHWQPLRPSNKGEDQGSKRKERKKEIDRDDAIDTRPSARPTATGRPNFAMVLTSAMTGRLEMGCKLLPFRESHEGRVVRASTPSAVPHNETRASKPACTVGANIQKAVQHLRIQLGHIKGDKSTSSSQGQLAARRVSGGGGKRSRGSTSVAKTIHPPTWFFLGAGRKPQLCFFFFSPILCCRLAVQRLPQHTSNDPVCCSSRTLAT